MDQLEDFMGISTALELSDRHHHSYGFGDDATTTSGSGGGVSSTTTGSVDSYMGSPLPSSWIEGIGLGSKDHELLGGYWRFSDAAYADEEGFHNSSLSPSSARLVLLDLSRFEGPGLELYCGIPTTIDPTSSDRQHIIPSLSIQPSSSPVDPGESRDKHENIKVFMVRYHIMVVISAFI